MKNFILCFVSVFTVLQFLSLTTTAHPLDILGISSDQEQDNVGLTEDTVDNEQVPAVEKEISENNGDLVIGDMIIPRSGISEGSGKTTKRQWPNGIVPYKIHSTISEYPNRMKPVQAAISDLNSKTCITLRPATSSDVGYIQITGEKSGCFAVTGYIGRKQDVNLGQGCYSKGKAVHEILHALGFFHEQARDDRDSFVQINYENIKPGKESQFNKVTGVMHSTVPYNYESVLHYSPTTFSTGSNLRTIQSLDNPEAIGNPNKMGQRTELSAGDILMVNEQYRTGFATPGIAGFWGIKFLENPSNTQC